MSEPTRDPIQDLENFGTGGIAVNPLEPAAVRRLGDKRRARRRNATMAIAAVAVLAATIPTALLANRDGHGPGQPIGTPDPTATPSVITFPGDGVHVTADADVARLEGTTEEFKTFIVTVLHKDDATCNTPDITVRKYSTAGYALGGVGGCGGYVALWSIQDGVWKEALGTQDEWRCPDLAKYEIPEAFAGSCYTPDPPPAVVTFPGNAGIDIIAAADVAELEGTTDDFKEFIASLLPAVKAEVAGCFTDPSSGGVHVKKFAQAGYALGSVDGCSGHAAIWKQVNGTWKEVLASQEAWNCGDLTRFGIPQPFAGEGCFGPKEIFGPEQDYGLRLGMTADEVRAAGGSLSKLGGNTCELTFAPGVQQDIKQDGNNNSIGYLSLSPDRGVVALFAQKDQVTPRGIRLGDTLTALKKAYPEGKIGDHLAWWVQIDAEHSYRFDIDGDGTIQNISLVLDGPQGCYE